MFCKLSLETSETNSVSKLIIFSVVGQIIKVKERRTDLPQGDWVLTFRCYLSPWQETQSRWNELEFLDRKFKRVHCYYRKWASAAVVSKKGDVPNLGEARLRGASTFFTPSISHHYDKIAVPPQKKTSNISINITSLRISEGWNKTTDGEVSSKLLFDICIKIFIHA